MARAIIIGGDPGGLKAGQTLARAGIGVTVIEAERVLGGLACAFALQGAMVERYCPFVRRGDDELVETLNQVGLAHTLNWRGARAACLADGTVHPFLTALDLLRFRPLGLVDRLRALLAVRRAQRRREDAERACAGFLSSWRGSEDLAYMDGGSQALCAGLAGDIRSRGGKVLLGTPIDGIVSAGSRVSGVRVGGELLPADAVLSTVAPTALQRLAPGLAGELVGQCARVPTLGVIGVVLRLTRAMTPFFLVAACDGRVPFDVLHEDTNLYPLPELGGDHIVHLLGYLPDEDSRFGRSDEEILRRHLDALALINPVFDPSWVRACAVFRDRCAHPARPRDCHENAPGSTSPVPNLLCIGSCQLQPHDRSLDGCLGLGRQAAEKMLALLQGRVE